MASEGLSTFDNENEFTKKKITLLSNDLYDEMIEVNNDPIAVPNKDVEHKSPDHEPDDKMIAENLSAKSGIPRPTSRPVSRPPSRPAPSARVRALSKGDLEEVDQNSADDDVDEEEDDEDDEDEEPGVQIEGWSRELKVILHGGANSPDKIAETASLSDELSCSDDELPLFDSSYDLLEEKRDRIYAKMPYHGGRAYDPADYEHLAVSNDMKELFQYITRYTPQTIELDHKLRPFIPEFIPAVGDIDAFIKVPRPDGQVDKLGLHVLDEPCAKQSDPTVLDLQLRAISKETTYKAMCVKSLENADKRPKEIDSWINSIGDLHRTKPPPTVNYSRNMPDIESLMQEWYDVLEECLNEVGLPSADLDCSLEEYIDIVCGLLDIPVYRSKVQSLHVLFTLYSEFKNSQHFKSLAMSNQLDNSLKSQELEGETDHLIIRN